MIHQQERMVSGSVPVATILLVGITLVLAALALGMFTTLLHKPSDPSGAYVAFHEMPNKADDSYALAVSLRAKSVDTGDVIVRIVSSGTTENISTIGERRRLSNYSDGSTIQVIHEGHLIQTYVVTLPDWCLDDNNGHGNECIEEDGGNPGKP